MNMDNYLINDVTPLQVGSKVKEAREVFTHLIYSHLPVEENGEFIGCISENDVYCFEGEKLLEDYSYAIEPFFVLEEANWLDVLKAFATHNCNIIPVLNSAHEYLGYYDLADIINIFNETPFLNESGGIIVIQKELSHYSFSEISQIVESNGTRIFGMFISEIEGDMVEITIKTGPNNINSIVQTFRRYNYDVISHHEEDKFLEDLKDRSNYLDKYLNI